MVPEASRFFGVMVANRMSKAVFKKQTKETNELRMCLELFGLAGFNVFRQNSGVARYTNKDGTERYVRYGFKGIPDLVGYTSEKSPRPVFWEVKRAGKEKNVSDEQSHFILKSHYDGCFSGIGPSEILEDRLKREGFLPK